MAPLLEELAADAGERLAVTTVDIDANPLVASRYRVRSLPILMLFKDGAVAATRVGALPRSALHQWVESVAG